MFFCRLHKLFYNKFLPVIRIKFCECFLGKIIKCDAKKLHNTSYMFSFVKHVFDLCSKFVYDYFIKYSLVTISIGQCTNCEIFACF